MDKINDTVKEINLRYDTNLFYLFTLESTISNISVFPLNPENINITFINNTNINITVSGLKGLAKSLTTLSYLSLDIDGDLLNADVTMIVDMEKNPFSLKKIELMNLDFDFKSKNLEKIYEFTKMIIYFITVKKGIKNLNKLLTLKKVSDKYMVVIILYDFAKIVTKSISYVSNYVPKMNVEQYIEDYFLFFRFVPFKRIRDIYIYL